MSGIEDENIIRKEGGVPAFVDPEVFAQVREKMAANRRQPGLYRARSVA